MTFEDITSYLEKSKYISSNVVEMSHCCNNSKLTVITGNNASGKSVLRKIISNKFYDSKIEFINLSLAGRCESGIVKGMIYGTETDESSGYNSTKSVFTAISTGLKRNNPFVIFLDEPEIGCSDELIAAFCIHIKENIEKMSNLEHFFIVTHSKFLIESLLEFNPNHIHMSKEYIGLHDWCKRKIIPSNFEDLKKHSHKLWSEIEKLKNQK
jgi:AAA15 family ATPase/GTPase